MRIGNVSFINSYPFQYGLVTLADFQISKLVPSAIAKALEDDVIDVGLVPVAVFMQHPEWSIVSDYCIGAEGAVKTVLLISKKPIAEVETICYDADSRSSNMLTKVLCANYWEINPIEVDSDVADACVMIGDKAFLDYSIDFPYCYDLAQEWFEFQKTPFVFAVWVAKKMLPKEELEKLNEALKYGVEHIEEAVSFFKDNMEISEEEAVSYLFKNISYPLDEAKKIAIQKFKTLSVHSDLI
jgi:chorismate dehydratase